MACSPLRGVLICAGMLVSLHAQNAADSFALDVRPTTLIARGSDGPTAVLDIRLKRALATPARISLKTESGVFVGEITPSPNEPDARFLVPSPLPSGERGRVIVELTEGDAHPSRSIDYPAPDPGWVLHLNPGFHFDPVWWNTQAHYAEDGRYLDAHVGPGLELVEQYLALLEKDPAYAVALHQLPYLKTFLEARPERREALLQAVQAQRAGLVGGTYNELQSTMVSGEAIARNAIYGALFQREVMGGDGTVFWQCDVFGHDPSFPTFMSQTRHLSGAFARGPFHQWGIARDLVNFPSEFEWVAPDGTGILTHYMTGHYGYAYQQLASGSNLATNDPRRAELVVSDMFHDLKQPALTHHVMLPLHSDFIRPLRNLGDLVKHWNERFVSPTAVIDRPEDFFAAVRAEVVKRGIVVPAITRDMNPIYTGCGVSFADLKLANRTCETTLRDAEILSTIAWLEGAPYPSLGLDRAWRQLLFCAHHDGITGSMSDQVYLDIMAAFRDGLTIATQIRENALRFLDGRADTSQMNGGSLAWNTLGSPRPAGDAKDATPVPAVGFVADPLPARPAARNSNTLENQWLKLTVSPAHGGGIDTLIWKPDGRSLSAGAMNSLVELGEYPVLPGQGEGPWHIATTGVRHEPGDLTGRILPPDPARGDEIVIESTRPDFTARQHIRLAADAPRIEFTTEILGWKAKDQLLRAEFALNLRREATPVFETAAAVIGRPFARDVDVAQDPWTLDQTFSQFFGLNDTLLAARPGIAEIIVATTATPARLELANDVARRLVKLGVTSTITRQSARRYGDLKLDSNTPTFRILVGSAAELPTDALPKDLPVVRVESSDDSLFPPRPVSNPADGAARAPLSAFILSDGPLSGRVSEAGVIGLNLLRGCTGWPSGFWVDPPSRRLPDHAPLGTMHGSHVFHYALQITDGAWRKGEITWHAQAFNQPLLPRTENAHQGPLGTRAEFLRVEPRTVLLQAWKPAGNPEAAWAVRRESTERKRAVVRLWNGSGEDQVAHVTFHHQPRQAWLTDLLEEPRSGAVIHDQTVDVPIGVHGIASVLVEFDATATAPSIASLDPTEKDHCPSAYWRENLGEGVTGNGIVSIVPAQSTVKVTELGAHVAVTLVDNRRNRPQLTVVRATAGPDLDATISAGPESPTAAFTNYVLTLKPTLHARRGRTLVTIATGGVADVQVTASIWAEFGAASDDGPEVTIDTPSPIAAAGGELHATLTNHTRGPITGVASWITPFVLWSAVPDWRQEVTIPAGGTVSIATPIGATARDSFALLRFTGGSRVFYGAAIAVTADPARVILAFDADRVRLKDGAPVELTVRATSLAQLLPDAPLDIEAPAGWTVREERRAVRVAGETSATKVTFSIVRQGGPPRGDLRATGPGGAAATVAYTVAPEQAAAQTADRITVDGDLSDWSPDEFTTAKGPLGAARCAVRYGAAGMVFAFDVTDETFFQPKTGASIWEGDSVQIAVSVSPSTALGYDARDLEFGAALTVDGPLAWCWYGGDGGRTGRVDGPVGIKKADGHLTYEFFIPAPALPRVTLTPGTRLGFCWIANDNDGTGYRGATEWTPGMTGTKDSSQFGELLLR